MAAAQEYAMMFKDYDIESIIEPNQRITDSTIVGEDFDKNIQFKIPVEHFKEAHAILERNAGQLLPTIDEHYYLYEFTDMELVTILKKPDEWNKLDFVLARQILSERGIDITDDMIEQYREERIKLLSKPENGLDQWTGLGYAASVIGGFMGMVIGWSLVHSKKTLPDGQQVFTYNEESRRHGRRIYRLGLFFLVVYMLFILVNAVRA